MEDIKTARQLMAQDCYVASIDLENALYVGTYSPKLGKYLRFIFRGIHYEFWVLPIGPCTAPYDFTKHMKPPISYLRQRGFTTVIYIDDNFVFERTGDKCLANIHASIKLFKKLGFSINDKKSNLKEGNFRKIK